MIQILLVMTGLMAGIYLIFSVVVMPVLSSLPGVMGAQTMNAINIKIVKTIFLPLFFISTTMHILFVFTALKNGTGFESLIFWAGLVYVIGMFVVTVCVNVPLNNRLQSATGAEHSLLGEWLTYVKWWTWFNHIRTWSCLVSVALLTTSLSQLP